MIKNKRQGFTLIEILIVVAIIAILASIVLVGLGPTQQSGRDAKRLSDLHEIQNGVELYYNKCGIYPGTSAAAGCPAWTTVDFTGLQASLIASGLGITSIPNDPSAPNKTYYYSSFNNGSTYTLGAQLENPNNSVGGPSYNAPANPPAGIPGGTCAFTQAQPNYCVTL